MPKINNYNSIHELDSSDFDPFEPIKKASGKNHGRLIKPAKVKKTSQKKLLYPRRILGDQDQKRLQVAVSERLLTSDLTGSASLVRYFGKSIISPRVARTIFELRYKTSDYHNPVRVFNHRVTSHIESANNAHPMLFAQLGEVGIFGSRDHNSIKHIGFDLKKDKDTDSLMIETSGLVHDLFDDYDDTLLDLYDNDRPHITVLSTYNADAAISIQNDFNDCALLKNAWVQILPSAPVKTTLYD